jgi:hypothetical protein
MRQFKSERLKGLESELEDLEQWLKLGLVPKKDIPKHKEEIIAIKEKITEELSRLRFLKESGQLEEYIAPKRATGRTGYTELGTLPDTDLTETGGLSDSYYGETTETGDHDTTLHDESDEEEKADAKGEKESHPEGEEAESNEEEEDDDAFSDRNRWRRGGIVDPDADEW